MIRSNTKHFFLGLAVALVWALQGCGGSGTQTATSQGSAPTAQTKANTAMLLAATGSGAAGAVFTPFGHGLPVPTAKSPGGPTYVPQLGLWMVVTVDNSTFTETFYQDQAETEPAGSAVYTLDVSTKTLSGTFSLTAGQYAGLSGTFSQTLTKNGTTGNYSLTLANGTTVSCSFTVSISALGVPSGNGTETVTEANGYSETATIVYNANGTKVVKASDSNGYTSVLNFNSDWSGTGTISGPDPGLPAALVWNSAGTGTITFDSFLVLHFTNWQLPTP